MPCSIKLESISGESFREIAQVAGGVITFGREPENGIIIDSSAISRRHGCMFQADQHWIFYDTGSTNGSFVNGVRVHDGQFRLLKDGDILQLADFSVRISYVGLEPEHSVQGSDSWRQSVGQKNNTGQHHGTDSATPAIASPANQISLLMFVGEAYSGDFVFDDAHPVFRFGGPQGIFLDQHPSEVARFSIASQKNGLELKVEEAFSPVIVNGSAVWGVTSLSDRDEVHVVHYRFLVNDNTSQVASSKTLALFDMASSGSQFQVATPEAHTQDHLPAQLRTRPPVASDGWESESAKRRLSRARKFVFNSANGDDLGGTISMPIEEFESQAGFETNPSLRFSMFLDDEKTSKPSEWLFGVLVATVVGLFVGLAVFIWLQWQA